MQYILYFGDINFILKCHDMTYFCANLHKQCVAMVGEFYLSLAIPDYRSTRHLKSNIQHDHCNCSFQLLGKNHSSTLRKNISSAFITDWSSPSIIDAADKTITLRLLWRSWHNGAFRYKFISVLTCHFSHYKSSLEGDKGKELVII